MSRPITPTTRPAMVRPRPAELSRSCPPQVPGPEGNGNDAEQEQRGEQDAQEQAQDGDDERGRGQPRALLGGGLLAVARSCGHLGLF
jgi:hypothetical protein